MAGIRDTPQDRATRDAAMTAGGEPQTKVALWVPASASPAPEVVEDVPIPSTTYGRRPGRGDRPQTVVASGYRFKLDGTDKRVIGAMKLRRQTWQFEAWDYIDEVPEAGHMVEFVANLLSKLRLFPAVRPDPNAPPIPVDDPDAGVDPTYAKIAQAVLDRLGALSTILGDLTFNFEVCGECYLHGHEDPETGDETWLIRSIDEIIVQGDSFALRGLPGTATTAITPIPEDDVVIRLWMQHRRFRTLATCSMRRTLSILENLLLLDRELRATSQSRLPNGMVVFPQEMSFGPIDPTSDTGDGEARADRFLEDFDNAVRTAIQEPGAASAAAPITLQTRAEWIDKIRFIEFSRKLDDTLEKRTEAQTMRAARGLAMPVEVTTGLQETTFANAAQVKRSEWDSYGEPKAMTIVDALTTGYYQWQLEEAGIPHEEAVRHFIWYDPSDCVAAPDPIDSADKGLEDGLINGAAWRRVKGWAESDAPDNDELLLRMLLKVSRPDPFVMAQLLRDSGIAPNLMLPAPQNGILGPNGEMPALPAAPNVPPGESPEQAPPGPPSPAEVAGTPSVAASAVVDVLIAANATQHHLGRVRGAVLSARLAQIDLHLRTRVHTAAEQAVRRMLERAGNKVKQRAARKGGDAAVRKVAEISEPKNVTASLGAALVAALDLSESDLTDGAFDDLLDDFDTWTQQAQEQALAALKKAGVDLSDADVEELKAAQDQHRDAGAGVLAAALGALAGKLLFTPPGAQPGGEAEVGVNVPMGLIRAALAVAGGDTINGPVDGALASGARGSGGVGGVASGPDVIDAATGDGGAVEGWVWDYGSTPRSPYEPHLALDGVVFESWDDDVLANDEDWPDTPYYFPGDHEWCACDSHAVLILPDGTPVEDMGPSTDESAVPEEQ